MTIATHQIGDFLKDPARKPDWAQLTRLAGDHAAILFEELRRRIGMIDGLVEELVYEGPDLGWRPRYRLGEATLFSVTIRPGVLEVALPLDAALRERVLKSPRVARFIKQVIESGQAEGDAMGLAMRLATLAQVRAFARVVLLKSRSADLAR